MNDTAGVEKVQHVQQLRGQLQQELVVQLLLSGSPCLHVSAIAPLHYQERILGVQFNVVDGNQVVVSKLRTDFVLPLYPLTLLGLFYDL